MATPEDGESTPNEVPNFIRPQNSFFSKEEDTEQQSAVDGQSNYWMRAFSYMLGNMNDRERQRFEQDQDIRYRESQCRRCENYRDHLLKYSPIVRFMADNINKVNGHVSKDTIHCVRCVGNLTGGFIPEDGSIILCQNKLRNQGHAEDSMAHEMVHAYDRLRFKTDWKDMRHLACTEIRASSLSGECRWVREFFTRKVVDFTQQHQSCVRRRATLSVMGHPKCESKEMAETVVNSVFESCFADTRPFAEIYR